MNLIEIEKVIKNIIHRKAVGFHGLTGNSVKYIYYSNTNLFYNIINCIWRNGVFPEMWKISKVILIPKDDKDLTMWDNYHPITLVSIWSKVIDKIVTNRLIYYLEDSQILHESQHGFRKNKSTLTALQLVKNYIESHLLNDELVCMIAIDIKNAFGSILKSDLLNILVSYKITSNITKFIDSYLSKGGLF